MSDKLQRAITRIKSGDKVEGRQLLTEALNDDPKSDVAWMWMSAVVETDELRQECLKEALKFNPNNQAARKGLAKLQQRQRFPATQEEKPPVETPPGVPAAPKIAALSFKFKYVRNGQVRGWFAQKGIANDRGLILGEDTLGYNDILDTTTRDNRLILAISPGTRLGKNLSKAVIDDQAVAVKVYKVKAQELEKYIDRMCSLREVERKRQELAAAGRADLFRATTCPECQAAIDLSELAETQYVYCRYCETVFTQRRQVVTKGSVYRVCGECGMFDRVRGYTEFYFYFLVVAYGFSYKRRYLCDSCANSLFWKMFLTNFLFVLGILPSIYLKIKSLTSRDPYLRELAKANGLARKGHHQKASIIFDRLYERYPDHPGLLMNEGLGNSIGNDVNGAVHCFTRSLKACSNYLPVAQLMRRMQKPGI